MAGSDQTIPAKNIATRNAEDNWFDVGFFISPQGYVTDIQLLRMGAGFERGWFNAVRPSLAGRRYTPTSSDGSDPGIFRVERWTLTSGYTMNSLSRLIMRSTRPIISMIDLTRRAPDTGEPY
ncbi:hypothetical protein [Sphingomonas sp.]